MRKVSQAFLSEGLSTTRTIKARATFRRTLLSFYKQNIVDDYPTGAVRIKSHDSDTYGGGFVRVSLVELSDGTHDIAIQHVTDPSQPVWSSWFLLGVSAMDGAFPAVHGNRVFYQDGFGDVYYVDIASGTAGTPVLVFSPVDRVWIAPVSSSEFYYYNVVSEELFYRALTGTEKQFPGRVLGNSTFYDSTTGAWVGRDVTNSPYSVGVDAVRGNYDGLGEADYLYITAENGVSAVQIVSRDTASSWSSPIPIMPLDNVGDDTRFDVTGAKGLGGKIFVTGVYVRPSNVAMLAYSMGPDFFTMGRDMFISADDVVTPRPIDDADAMVSGGEMHLVGDSVWFLSPGGIYKSDATILVGVDNPGLKFVTDKINSIKLRCNENSSWRLSFDIETSQNDPAVARGNEVELEVAINDIYETVGVFGIEGVFSSKDGDGTRRFITARSASIRRLSQWTSDAYYDHWSQSKKRSKTLDHGDLVRVRGAWDLTNNVLSPTSLNVDCVAYSPEAASRGRVVRAKFVRRAGRSAPLYGVIASYRQNTEWYQVGTPSGAQTESSPSDNGIAVLINDPNIEIYTIYQDEWTLFYSGPIGITIYDDDPHWLEVVYQDGHLRVLFRRDAVTAWTELYSGVYTDPLLDQFPDGVSGRGAVFMRNRTPYANGYALAYESTILGVDDNSPFAVGDVVVVNEEHMAITGKSSNITSAPKSLEWREEISPSSGSFSGYPICFDATGRNDLDYGKDDLDGLALVITDGPGKGYSWKIVDYDKWASQADTVRVMIDQDPRGALGKGSVADIVPALYVTRAQDGTNATTHRAAQVDVYASNYIELHEFATYTKEPDIPFAEMVKTLARRAGVMDIKLRYYNASEGGFVFPDPSPDYYVSPFDEHMPSASISGDYDIVPPMLLDDNDFLIDVQPLPDAGPDNTIWIHFGMKYENGAYVDGCSLAINPDDLVIYDNAGGTHVELERFPSGDIVGQSQGMYRVSVFDGQVSVWANGRLVHVFDIGDPSDPDFDVLPGTYMKLTANWTPGWSGPPVPGDTPYQGPFRYRLYRLNNRVDNFVMDMGQRGSQLISALIGEKRIYFRDGKNGELTVYRDRDEVGSDVSPFRLAVSGETGETDSRLITRILIEGGDVAEAFDIDAMREQGNLFGLVNSQELVRFADLVGEAGASIVEAASLSAVKGLSGAADIRVEPGDILYIDIGDGPEKTLVGSVSFSMNVTRNDAMFDMQLSGREAPAAANISVGHGGLS